MLFLVLRFMFHIFSFRTSFKINATPKSAEQFERPEEHWSLLNSARGMHHHFSQVWKQGARHCYAFGVQCIFACVSLRYLQR